MKKTDLIHPLMIVALVSLLYRCSTEKKTIASIIPPLENVNVALKEFTIDATKGGTIKNEHGSTVVIPADAFTDANGNKYNGPVVLQYREFHNSAEILASGIPMKYDSGGKQIDLQTAGMFEINAQTIDKQDLSIAEGKELTVNMASFVNGGQYNFYHLNEEKGWEYSGKTAPEKNVEKEKILAALPDEIPSPVKPVQLKENEKVFDLSFNESEHPELNGFSDVMWQYSGAEGGTSDPSQNPWVFTYNWQKADLGKYNVGKMEFDLLLSSPQKTFTTTVSPVLKGKALKKAMKEFEEKLATFKKVKEEREQVEELASKQGDFVRSFAVKNFGIYNWDCALSQPGRMVMKAEIKFDTDVSVPKENLMIYLVTGSNRSLVKYSYYDLDKFAFDPNEDNQVVVILPGNKLAMFSPKQFQQLDIEKIRNEKECEITLHVTSLAVKNMDDLCAALGNKTDAL